MKLAILMALSADLRTGKMLTANAVPYDEALAGFKAINGCQEGPAPVVQLWTTSGLAKSCKFAAYPKDWNAEAVACTPLLSNAEITELTEAHKAATSRIGELEGRLAERDSSVSGLRADIAKLEEQLKEAAAAAASQSQVPGSSGQAVKGAVPAKGGAAHSKPPDKV